MSADKLFLNQTCIIEDDYIYRLCPECSAHIYNGEGICGLCDADEMTPEEEFQLEHCMDTQPINFDNFVSDPNEYK